jgi:hypothetical protein
MLACTQLYSPRNCCVCDLGHISGRLGLFEGFVLGGALGACLGLLAGLLAYLIRGARRAASQGRGPRAL